jgi:hypothetical protein
MQLENHTNIKKVNDLRMLDTSVPGQIGTCVLLRDKIQKKWLQHIKITILTIILYKANIYITKKTNNMSRFFSSITERGTYYFIPRSYINAPTLRVRFKWNNPYAIITAILLRHRDKSAPVWDISVPRQIGTCVFFFDFCMHSYDLLSI